MAESVAVPIREGMSLIEDGRYYIDTNTDFFLNHRDWFESYFKVGPIIDNKRGLVLVELSPKAAMKWPDRELPIFLIRDSAMSLYDVSKYLYGKSEFEDPTVWENIEEMFPGSLESIKDVVEPIANLANKTTEFAKIIGAAVVAGALIVGGFYLFSKKRG